MSSREDLLGLLKRALPALRASANSARGERAWDERLKLVRAVEGALEEDGRVDLELSELVNEAVKKEDPLEAIETLWREGKRRADAGEHGSKEMQLIAAFIIVLVPALMSEVRKSRLAKSAKKKKWTTREAHGVCPSCKTTNAYAINVKAQLEKVEADCAKCNTRIPKLEWKPGTERSDEL